MLSSMLATSRLVSLALLRVMIPAMPGTWNPMLAAERSSQPVIDLRALSVLLRDQDATARCHLLIDAFRYLPDGRPGIAFVRKSTNLGPSSVQPLIELA